MSDSAQKSFCIYHSSVLDLVQEVKRCNHPLAAILAHLRIAVPAVRVQPLSVRVGLLVVWGVLVTARQQDEILSAWCVADQTTLPVGAERQTRATERQDTVRQRIEEILRAARLQVQAGCYAVPEAAFRQVAALAKNTPEVPQGGQR